MQNISINDNISFHYIPMQKLKTSTIGIFVHTPLTRENAAYTALLPSVLKRGCKVCPDTVSMEHYLQDLYGAEAHCSISQRAEDHIMQFTYEAISDKYAINGEKIFASLTKLAMSILFEPVTDENGFKKDFVEQEKKNIIERIESIKNDKRAYASKRCIEELCRGDIYSINKLGTVKAVTEITEKSLYDYYKSVITSSEIDIYVSGDVNTDEIIKTIKEYIKDKAFTKGEIRLTSLLTPQPDGTPVNLVEEEMDVTQGKLSIGFTTDTPSVGDDYYALMVANSIFGAGAHSKLFNNVREKLSLCYYASSAMDRAKGFMIVNAGIEFDKYEAAYNEILAQLSDVKNGKISDLEYTSSINSLVNSLKSCFDDQYAMQTFSLSEKIYGSNMTLDDVIAKIQNVTVSDAVAAAQKIKLDTVYFLKGAETNAQ